MEDVKAKILFGSEQLFMRYGLKSVSMDDVAKHIGISKKTIYNYLKDKKDLVFQVLQSHFAKNEAECKVIFGQSINPVEQMLHIAEHITNNYKSLNPGLINDLRKYFPKSWELFNEYKNNIIKQYVLTNLKEGMKLGYYRQEIDPDTVANLYLGLTEVVTQSSSFEDNEQKFPRIIKEMINYHLHGVCTPNGLLILNSNQKSTHE